jgi:hypothetical protein
LEKRLCRRSRVAFSADNLCDSTKNNDLLSNSPFKKFIKGFGLKSSIVPNYYKAVAGSIGRVPGERVKAIVHAIAMEDVCLCVAM